MKAKQQLVIINLQKVSNGYMVVDKFEEKVSTKIKIPKTILNPPKPIEVKQPEIKPAPQPKQQQHPPPQIAPPPIQYQPPKPIWNPQPPPQQVNPEQTKVNQHSMMFQAPIPPQEIPKFSITPPPQIQQQTFTPPQQQIIPQQPQNINQTNENQKQEQQKRVLQKYQLVIPSCANWFQMDNIHDLEKKQFPEYFSGQHISKTPELYKKYRNFIVNLYRNSPSTYLTTIACRKVLAGDACTITRIHGFLQYWGLINYSVDPDTCPNKVLPQISMTKNLYRQLQLNAKDELDEKLDLNPNEVSLVNTIKAFSKKYRPICTFCGIICGLQWFDEKEKKNDETVSKAINNDNETSQNNNEVQSKMSLCVKCYSSNSFPNNLTSEDFENTNLEQKFNQIHLLSKEPKQCLNDSEVGFVVQIFQENPETNWEKIAHLLNQTFKTNYTEEDVILHFLQYPIELFVELDKVLDSKECLDKLKLSDVAEKIPFEEPNIFDDNQNLVSFHLSIFRKLLNKFTKKENNKEKEENDEAQKQNQEIELESQNAELKRVLEMSEESLENAKLLQSREEEKLNSHINLLISFQMEKLEHKLTFLEEYEKLILYEKQQLEICQKQTLAERLQILQQKLQLYQDSNQ